MMNVVDLDEKRKKEQREQQQSILTDEDLKKKKINNALNKLIIALSTASASALEIQEVLNE